MTHPIQFESDHSSTVLAKNSQGDTILRIDEDRLTEWIFYNEDDGHVFNGSKQLAREIAIGMLEALQRRTATFGDHLILR